MTTVSPVNPTSPVDPVASARPTIVRCRGRSNGRNSRLSLVTTIIFFILVVVGGVALASSNYWENPFAVLNQLSGSGMVSEGREGFTRPSGTESGGAGTRGQFRAGEGRRGGGRGSGSFSWSQVGTVLFNVWFMAATVGVMMVAALPFRFIRKQLRIRRRNGHLTAASQP